MKINVKSSVETGYDGLAVALFEGSQSGLEGLEAKTGAVLATLAAGGSLKELYSSELVLLEEGSAATRLLAIGAGKAEEYEMQTVRRLAGMAARTFRKKGAQKIAIMIPSGTLAVNEVAQAVAEGVILSLPDSGAYKTGDKDKEKLVGLAEVTLIFSGDSGQIQTSVERGQIVGEGINLARRLADEPGNVMYPARLAEEAQKVAQVHNLEFDALDLARLEEGGFKAIIGVGQGSEHEPRMIVLKYNGAGEGQPYIGLIGKGITFDTGGISIKPAAGMENLKYDMSGGAWVIGALQILAQIKPQINVLGVIAAAENMPGANAYRPGDVIGSLEGKTIEVSNTDAEGRIVLADGLTYARQLGATKLVDLATLTGAARMALGSSIAVAVFGSDRAWTELFLQTAEAAGERAWQLPLFPEYTQLIKSKIADLNNSVGGGGGASTGAAFVKEFSGGLPWIHLDIAPVSRTDEKPYIAKGSSGHILRTLVDFVLANES